MATYAIRLVCMVICLELGTHWAPCFALGASGAFVSTGPFEIGLLAYLTLNLMWFKFTIIWRYAIPPIPPTPAPTYAELTFLVMF